jgi:hypothetical protein
MFREMFRELLANVAPIFCELMKEVINLLTLKGQCHEISDPRIFHQNIHPGPLIKGLKPFRI